MVSSDNQGIFKLQLILNFSCMQIKDKSLNHSQCLDGMDCPIHTFKLESENPEGSKIALTQVNLCPKTQGGCCPGNIYPEWNDDELFYTSCFTLGVDKHYNEQNRSFEFDSFKRRVEMACFPSSQLVFPRPAQQHKYCNVCKQSYEDYMWHINSEQHSISFQSPVANLYIQDLCQIYPQASVSKRKRVWKPKPIPQQKLVEIEKGLYEGSTLATRKINRDELAESEKKEKAPRHKGICKVSSRKMSLRNYKPN